MKVRSNRGEIKAVAVVDQAAADPDREREEASPRGHTDPLGIQGPGEEGLPGQHPDPLRRRREHADPRVQVVPGERGEGMTIPAGEGCLSVEARQASLDTDAEMNVRDAGRSHGGNRASGAPCSGRDAPPYIKYAFRSTILTGHPHLTIPSMRPATARVAVSSVQPGRAWLHDPRRRLP